MIVIDLIVIFIGLVCVIFGVVRGKTLLKSANEKLDEASKQQTKASLDLAAAQAIKLQKRDEQFIYDFEFNRLTEEIAKLSEVKEEVEKETREKKEYFDWLLNNERAKVDNEVLLYRSNLKKLNSSFEKDLEEKKTKLLQEYDERVAQVTLEREEIENKLEQLRNTLSAGIEANLREQQMKEQIEFYKLKVDENDLSDIRSLESLKRTFNKPVVLSKLIWSNYFQKQTTELCNRLLGSTVKCGIYKITNLQTNQCYIGQSVNIAERWKQHIKCGLGIEASATNKLYSAMQKDGVWNFSFELMEECPRELLNEKEKFWIEMFRSDKLGYNTTGGNR